MEYSRREVLAEETLFSLQYLDKIQQHHKGYLFMSLFLNFTTVQLEQR
jgi:hypothetical protein